MALPTTKVKKVQVAEAGSPVTRQAPTVTFTAPADADALSALATLVEYAVKALEPSYDYLLLRYGVVNHDYAVTIATNLDSEAPSYPAIEDKIHETSAAIRSLLVSGDIGSAAYENRRAQLGEFAIYFRGQTAGPPGTVLPQDQPAQKQDDANQDQFNKQQVQAAALDKLDPRRIFTGEVSLHDYLFKPGEGLELPPGLDPSNLPWYVKAGLVAVPILGVGIGVAYVVRSFK